MSERTVLAIRHVAFEELGSFADPLERAGYRIGYCDAAEQDLGAIDPVEADLLVVLGGPVGRILFHRLSRTPEREAGDEQRMGEAWSTTHHAFQAALVHGCDSPWLLRPRRTLYAQSEHYRRLSVPMADAPRDLGREHRELMEAALARDASRAKALMAEHLKRTARVLLEQSWPADAPGAPDRLAQCRAPVAVLGAGAR